MKTIDSLERDILALSEEERNQLLERLSGSLFTQPPGDEEPDSVSEAFRRQKELMAEPSIGITWQEIKSNLGRS